MEGWDVIRWNISLVGPSIKDQRYCATKLDVGARDHNTSILRMTNPSRTTGFATCQPYLTVTLFGGLCEQAMLSVMPEEIWAQAVSVAVRRASSGVAPAAVTHAV
jgi:hypothetical protein